MTRFLSVGEIMVEMAPAGDGLFAKGYAGDTFNCAWYARRLLGADWSVGYATRVGQDAVSEDMVSFIAREGIEIDAVQRDRERTVGLYLIQLAGGERSFSYWRGQSAAKRLGDDPNWLRAVLRGAAQVQFSGITLAILPPAGRETLCSVLTEARRAGTRVAFDTNLRPRLWEDADAMRDGLMMGARAADTVLPSFDEEQLAWGDATPDETIARYREAGARSVIVKNGAEMVHGWDAEAGAFRADPPPVAQIVDTTAAGDSFAAGFLAARLQGASAPKAAEAAAALASKVIQKRGALAPDLF